MPTDLGRQGVATLDAPVVSVAQLIAQPGTHPTLRVPVRLGAGVEVAVAWRHLAETAAFFGVAMPDAEALATEIAAALAGAVADPPADVVVVAVTLFGGDGSTRIAARTEPVPTGALPPVRIVACDVPGVVPDADAPPWRRLAARTTSAAERDQLHRWLAGRDAVDAVPTDPAGAPYLGALVFDTDAGLVGMDRPEPHPLLEQAAACGLLPAVARAVRRPVAPRRAWWVSPGFGVHPVARLGDAALDATAAVPA